MRASAKYYLHGYEEFSSISGRAVFGVGVGVLAYLLKKEPSPCCGCQVRVDKSDPGLPGEEFGQFFVRGRMTKLSWVNWVGMNWKKKQSNSQGGQVFGCLFWWFWGK